MIFIMALPNTGVSSAALFAALGIGSPFTISETTL